MASFSHTQSSSDRSQWRRSQDNKVSPVHSISTAIFFPGIRYFTNHLHVLKWIRSVSKEGKIIEILPIREDKILSNLCFPYVHLLCWLKTCFFYALDTTDPTATPTLFRIRTREDMESDIRQGAYVEWGTVDGHHYGIKFAAIREIIATGRTALIDCQCQVTRMFTL